MEKLAYILWKDSDKPRADFAAGLLQDTAPALLALDEVRHLQLNLVDEAVRPGEEMLQCNTLPRMHAVFWVWLDSAFRRAPVEQLLARAVPRMAGYLLTESMPLVNTEHRAGLGERTPGFCQVTYLQKPPRLAREDWLKVWLESHTQVAIDTQSTFLYVQNVVARPLSYNAPHFDAIVEEGFPEAALTSWAAFYDAENDEEKFKKRQKAMIDSCVRFIDFDRLDVSLTSQYVLR